MINLVRRKVSMFYSGIPMLFMVFMTGWAMILNLQTYYQTSNWLLFGIGLAVFALEIWMIIESVIVLKSLYGNGVVGDTDSAWLEPVSVKDDK